jgi:hypothetical protein
VPKDRTTRSSGTEVPTPTHECSEDPIFGTGTPRVGTDLAQRMSVLTT